MDDFESGQIDVTAEADSSAPAFLPVKFSVQEFKNTRPIRPPARMCPETPSRADLRAAKRTDETLKTDDNTMKTGSVAKERADRAGNFHFPEIF